MSVSESYRIESTDGTTTSLLAANPVSITIPPMSATAAPAYSPVVGSGGSTGGGWPFQDYNVMNDPEGNLSALPPIFLDDGTGGQGTDSLALKPIYNDNGLAGYGNAGAGMSGSQAVGYALGDPGYVAGATALNASDLGGAENQAMIILAQNSSKIDWNAVAQNQHPDVSAGFMELTQSAGATCAASISSTAGGMIGAAKLVVASKNGLTLSGSLVFATVQLLITGATTMGKCIIAADHAGPLDANENMALGTVYRSLFSATTDMRNYGPGAYGGDAVSATQKADRSGGTVKSYDANVGGTMNFLTSYVDPSNGSAHVIRG